MAFILGEEAPLTLHISVIAPGWEFSVSSTGFIPGTTKAGTFEAKTTEAGTTKGGTTEGGTAKRPFLSLGRFTQAPFPAFC